jgi:hypothetical protein
MHQGKEKPLRMDILATLRSSFWPFEDCTTTERAEEEGEALNGRFDVMWKQPMWSM